MMGALLGLWWLLSAFGRRERVDAVEREDADADAVADEILRAAKRDLQPLKDTKLKELAAPRGSVTLLEDEIRTVPARKAAKPSAPAKRSSKTQPTPTPPSGDGSDARDAAEAAALAEAAERQLSQGPAKQAPAPAPKKRKKRPAQEVAPQPTLKIETKPAAPVAPVRVLPDGYNPEAARREAQNVARHLYNAGGGYDAYRANAAKWAERARGSYARSVIAGWQKLAGLNPDGVYGPATHNALTYYGASSAPPSLFRKRSDGTYWTDSDPRAAYVPPEQR